MPMGIIKLHHTENNIEQNILQSHSILQTKKVKSTSQAGSILLSVMLYGLVLIVFSHYHINFDRPYKP